MTPGRIVLEDPSPPSSGYRHAGLGALTETFLGQRAGRGKVVVPAAIDPASDVHDRQHVTPDGAPAINGVIWLERAGLRVEQSDAARSAVLVLGEGETWRGCVTWRAGDGFEVSLDRPAAPHAAFSIDRYRRPILAKDAGMSSALSTPPARPSGADHPLRATGRIAILADPARARWVYPAVHAALGDAADSLAVTLEIEAFLPTGRAPELERFDGVVLPGGADLERTLALVWAAEICRTADIPAIGLCLGMQAMCVAAAQRVPVLRGAALQETAPDAEFPLFTRFHATASGPVRRMGDRRVVPRHDSPLARRCAALGLATSWMERMNHAHRLDPSCLPAFRQSGLAVTAADQVEGTVDLVEDPAATFHVGAEGHPELTSRRGAPHPAICAFLAAALGTTG